MISKGAEFKLSLQLCFSVFSSIAASSASASATAAAASFLCCSISIDASTLAFCSFRFTSSSTKVRRAFAASALALALAAADPVDDVLDRTEEHEARERVFKEDVSVAMAQSSSVSLHTLIIGLFDCPLAV